MAKKHSKRYAKCLEQVPEGAVSVAQAVDVIKNFPKANFDPTVELVMWLGIDPRQADQALRGSISLPNGIGVSRKVIAFCDGDDVQAALDAGATEAASDELVEKIQKGWMDFDVAIATPSMMRVVSKLGRLLGPQGKMPSPKAGTVVKDITAAVKEFAAGKVEYRNDDGGNLHVPVGKASFDTDKLVENIDAFMTHVKKLRPTSTKGVYIKKVCLAATMSPAVAIQSQ